MRFLRKLFSKKPEYHWEMTPRERNLFLETITGAKNYLEWGAGGTTIAVLQNYGCRVYCVESSAEWSLHMQKAYPQIRAGMESGQLALKRVDIGKTKAWGVPADESRKEHWPKYSSEIFGDKIPFDVVLVDGRFRVACALQAILNTDDNAVIMVHDFSNRPKYHILLKYLDVAAVADTLVVFKKKEKIDKKQVAADYKKYKYICD